MPPHKETALEKSIRHSIKSAEAAMKADRASIVAVMNKSPSCVTKLKKTLRDLGYIDEKDCVIERHEAKGPTLQPAPSPAKSPTDFCDEEQLPSSAQTLNDCDVGLLAYWLERCEPIVFNKHSLKALLKRNQRKVSKEPLLECTEFMTDIPRDLNIASLATVGGVAAMLMKKNEANSRRAKTLRLPPMWGAHGVGIFTLFFQDGEAHLQDQFTGASGRIEDKDLLANFSTDPTLWAISNSFSKQRACIQRCGIMTTRVPCLSVVPRSISAPPASSARALPALTNGTDDDGGCSSTAGTAGINSGRASERNAPQLALQDEDFVTPPTKKVRRRGCSSPLSVQNPDGNMGDGDVAGVPDDEPVAAGDGEALDELNVAISADSLHD